MNKAFFTLSLCLVAQSTQLSAMEAASKFAPPIHIHNYPLNSGAGSSVFRYACYAAIIGGTCFAIRRFSIFDVIKMVGRYAYGAAALPIITQNTSEIAEETKGDVKTIIAKIDATDREISALKTHFDDRFNSFERNLNTRLDRLESLILQLRPHHALLD